MRSFFQRLARGLAKTQQGLTDRIKESIGLRPRLVEQFFDDLEAALIAADCGVDVAATLATETRHSCERDRVTDSAESLVRLKAAMAQILHSMDAVATPPDSDTPPRVALFVGVNGAGKTTSIGKIGCHYARVGRRVLFASADTFRAAAGEQLEIWAERAGAQLIRSVSGADPAAVAFDAVSAARARGLDDVLIDTAGRLQTKSNLMAELAKIRRSADKARGDSGGAAHAYLVMDATTGQNGLSQAAEFAKAVQVEGIVLTKLDGTAKGGIVLAIAHRLKIPVLWVGVGESIDDLETFDADEFVTALLG
ncbi:MAG: signal recognition particle-docking protein FtsY [candidate division Zixibacteria bacterium]|nr:signal recognition particle-docking protein FtsY [candidate division Zixibacteria bacterium]